jgi:hypothetical protein
MRTKLQPAGSFAATLDRFTVRSMDHADAVRRAVTIKLLSSVVMDTPVDTGRLRANWTLSRVAPVFVATEQTDPAGQMTLQLISDGVAKSKFGETLWLTNSLPYAARIEFDGWSHTKAPEGMVRRNVVRLRALIASQNRKGTP